MTGRPRSVYRESVAAAVALREVGTPWDQIAAFLHLDRGTIARAVRRGPEHYPPFYVPDRIFPQPEAETASPPTAKLDQKSPGGRP